MSPHADNAQTNAAQVTRVHGTGIAVRGNDIDTDRIIPARFLKVVTFDGIGEFAFQDVRIDENGTVTDHPFNNPVYRKASILLALTDQLIPSGSLIFAHIANGFQANCSQTINPRN